MSRLVEDLDVIGHLDFPTEVGCQWRNNCKEKATLLLVTSLHCPCPDSTRGKPLCLFHTRTALDYYDANRDEPAAHRECGTFKRLRDLLTIDRIEPLR